MKLTKWKKFYKFKYKLVSGQVHQDVQIVPQVRLGSHQNDGDAPQLRADLPQPLVADVVQRRGVHDAEASHYDVTVVVREPPHVVEVVLKNRKHFYFMFLNVKFPFVEKKLMGLKTVVFIILPSLRFVVLVRKNKHKK